jgi:hypothetical protein
MLLGGKKSTQDLFITVKGESTRNSLRSNPKPSAKTQGFLKTNGKNYRYT